MRSIKNIFILMCGLVIAASCSDDATSGAGNPVLSIINAPAAALYGDSIHFQVQCSDANGVDLSTLKAYMEYSGEQVSSQVTRTKTEGAYNINLFCPLRKNVPDGTAKIRLVLQNIRLAKTEQTVDLPVSRPHYESITFIPSNGKPVVLTPEAADPFLFKGSYTSKNRTFKGHFVAPKVGANGNEITFGQGNESVTEGRTDDILFNGNRGANTVTFNVLSYDFGPQTADPSASIEIVLTKDANAYVGELSHGGKYEFAGESIINSGRWFHDADWFTKNGDGTYTFLGLTGLYTVKADYGNLAFRIWKMNDATHIATLNADGTGALWIIGNNGVGKPAYTASNVHDWWTGEDYDYCLTPIADKRYRITLTVGKQLNPAKVNFKFFGQAGWGTEFKGSAGDYLLTTSSDVFGIGNGTEVNGVKHDDGNIYLRDGVELTIGDTYVFTVDLSAGCANGVLTITKQ